MIWCKISKEKIKKKIEDIVYCKGKTVDWSLEFGHICVQRCITCSTEFCSLQYWCILYGSHSLQLSCFLTFFSLGDRPGIQLVFYIMTICISNPLYRTLLYFLPSFLSPAVLSHVFLEYLQSEYLFFSSFSPILLPLIFHHKLYLSNRISFPLLPYKISY